MLNLATDIAEQRNTVRERVRMKVFCDKEIPIQKPEQQSVNQGPQGEVDGQEVEVIWGQCDSKEAAEIKPALSKIERFCIKQG